MSSSLPLPLTNPSLTSLHSLKLLSLSPFPISSRSPPPPPFFTATDSCPRASSGPSNSDPEEARWLREERRWLREEQRWLREERRWCSERESLLREISELRLRIQALEREGSARGASVSETLSKVAALLQVLKDAENGSRAQSSALEAAKAGREVVEGVVVNEVVRVSDGGGGGGGEEKTAKRTSMLRKGSEGEEVRVMQVCEQ